jgi:hypothetical protein
MQEEVNKAEAGPAVACASPSVHCSFRNIVSPWFDPDCFEYLSNEDLTCQLIVVEPNAENCCRFSHWLHGFRHEKPEVGRREEDSMSCTTKEETWPSPGECVRKEEARSQRRNLVRRRNIWRDVE